MRADGPQRRRRPRHRAARRRSLRRHGARSRATSAATLITVCERGYGKRTALGDYPVKNRGGKGVITIKTTARNGLVSGVRIVTDDDHLILISRPRQADPHPRQGHAGAGPRDAGRARDARR